MHRSAKATSSEVFEAFARPASCHSVELDTCTSGILTFPQISVLHTQISDGATRADRKRASTVAVYAGPLSPTHLAVVFT